MVLVGPDYYTLRKAAQNCLRQYVSAAVIQLSILKVYIAPYLPSMVGTDNVYFVLCTYWTQFVYHYVPNIYRFCDTNYQLHSFKILFYFILNLLVAHFIKCLPFL